MLSFTCPPMYLSSSFPPERAAGFWVCCNDGFQRGVKRKPMASIKKLRKAKREAPDGEKPEPLRTHLRNMIIVPEMIGHYLSEFSISYKPVMHGRPGIGATRSFRSIPL